MPIRFRSFRAAAIVLFVALAPWPATAQTTRSGGGDTARLQQQLQQLASERTALQSENARLKQQLDEAQQKLGSVTTQQAALERRAMGAEATAKRLAASSSAGADAAARSRAQMEELVEKFRETAQSLKAAEAERAELRQRLAGEGQQLARCRASNAELLQINEEVLVRLENTGFWTKLAADEPFTRLKRTQLENLAAEYRARAADLAVPDPGKAP
jgi:chromosome segregation ATPase